MWSLFACLLIGVALGCALCWLPPLVAPPGRFDYPSPAAARQFIEQRLDHEFHPHYDLYVNTRSLPPTMEREWSEVWMVEFEHRMMGLAERIVVRRSLQSYEEWVIWESGWPLRCERSIEHNPGPTASPPNIEPDWRPLAANSVLLAFALWLIALAARSLMQGWRQLRAGRRLAMGMCTRCGYPTDGDAARCPECGQAPPHRGRHTPRRARAASE